MSDFDVLILSTHSKGICLANELTRFRKKVAFVDLTKNLPPSSDEDISSPFGFFPSQITEPYDSWWRKTWRPSPFGFSILSRDIFFHFKEVMLASIYQKRKDYLCLIHYLQNQKKPQHENFKNSWLIHFVQRFSSGVESRFNQPLPQKRILPLMEDFGILLPPFQKVKDQLNPQVFLTTRSQWDLQIPSNSKDHFLFLDQNSRPLRSKYCVFMMGPAELDLLHPSLFHLLFSKKNIHPTWCWQRVSFELDDQGYDLPSYFVVVDPDEIPWTYDRLLCLKRSSLYKNRMNVWFKFPFLDSSSSSSFVREFVPRIQKKLEQFFPPFKWTLIPQNVTNRFLFPIYSFEDFKKMSKISHARFFYSYDAMDLNSFRMKEIEILKKIKRLDKFNENHQNA